MLGVMSRDVIRALTLVPAALLALMTSSLAADDCPFGISDYDKIEAALKAAPTCAAAVSIFRGCALGAGGDVARGAIAQERCERDFLASLRATEGHAYKRQIGKCWQNLKDGSMYRAMAAGCAVDVAERYSRRALKP
jgi:hypothetical protein